MKTSSEYINNQESEMIYCDEKVLAPFDGEVHEDLKKALVVQYAKINDAFYNWDSHTLKSLCSLDVYVDYKKKKEFLDAAFEKEFISDVDFYDVSAVYAEKCDDEYLVDLTVKYACIEYTVDKFNQVIRGSKDVRKVYVKRLSFSKKLFAEKIAYCPNCCASVSDDSTQYCDFCNNILNYQIGVWLLKKETIISED